MSSAESPSETTSENRSEPAIQESSSPPAKNNRKLLIVVISVVVAALLLSSVLYLFVLSGLSAKLSAETANIDAGKKMEISVDAKWGMKSIDRSDGATFSWSVSPESLADFDVTAQKSVTMTAGNDAGNGTVKVHVEYKGKTLDKTMSLTVKPPFLDSVSITPSVKTLVPGDSQSFVAIAYSSVGLPLTRGVTFTWTLEGNASANCDLNATAGTNVSLSSAQAAKGVAFLNCTAQYSAASKVGNANITIGEFPARNVSYRWYDMFNVPFGDWWIIRNQTAGDYEPWTWTYPYIFRWHGFPSGNLYYYTNMMFNISARNLQEINMLSHPEFLPIGISTLGGSQRGGTAVLSWQGGYMSDSAFNLRGLSGNDGWLWRWWGNTTLDRQGAKTILGVTDAGFDDFANWWSANKGTKANAYQNWVDSEGNNRPQTAIFAAYGTNVIWLDFKLDAAKVGDKVVITFDTVSWGMEILMAKWLREAFVATEWYYEYFHMNATIGPEMTSNLYITTAAEMSAYAYETTDIPLGATHGEPSWDFEALIQDYLPSDLQHRYSLFDRYWDPLHAFPRAPTPYEYLNNAPGSGWYGKSMKWDYTPWSWNLTANETLSFDWPTGDQLFYYHIGDNKVGQQWDKMVVNYSEPEPSDLTTAAGTAWLKGKITIDNTANRITFTGPMNMYNWSRTQTAHQALWEQWHYQTPGVDMGNLSATFRTNGGLMPYGAPFIEFKKYHYAPPPPVLDHFDVSIDQNPVVTGELRNLTVKAIDQFGKIYTRFVGTVNFTANKTGAVLPANYTYLLTDAGNHTFSGVVFTVTGKFSVTVFNTTDKSKNGTLKNIMVIAEEQKADHLVVSDVTNMGIGGMSNVRVTVYDQFGSVYTGYLGSVNFTTNATLGTFIVPSNYTFAPGDMGTKLFVKRVSFSVAGVYNVTVVDTSNSSVRGSQENIHIQARNAQTAMTLYDMFQRPWGAWWPWRLPAYGTDYLLNQEPGKYTMLYNPDGQGTQGIIQAPYRWNVVAKNVTAINASHPEFMPVYGPRVSGAVIDLTLNWDYINDTWWNDYWLPVWHSNVNWSSYLDALLAKQHADGYHIGAIFTATMNREAALEWLNMPLTASVGTWWTDNQATYIGKWSTWVYNEGNVRLDIYSGFDAKYSDWATMMNMVENVATGEVILQIGHVNWGLEVLTDRWMTESTICTHETYMENFTMVATFGDSWADVTYDGNVVYNLHAVGANGTWDGTKGGSAWVWDPQRVDYEVVAGHPSQYGPWNNLYYQGWNCGDPNFGWPGGAGYDSTPGWLNLSSYETLTIKVPSGDDVLGYKPGPVDPMAILNMAWYHDYSAFNSIMMNGSMQLGYFKTDGPYGAGIDLRPLWDNTTKTLTIHGPVTFDNYHWGPGPTGDPLYHGAPWIEFNVTPVAKAKALGLPAAPQMASGAASVAGDVSALAVVIFAAFLTVVALGCSVKNVVRKMDQPGEASTEDQAETY